MHKFLIIAVTALSLAACTTTQQGATVGTLTSTQTAHAFYRALGWEDSGPPDLGHNIPGYPMRKVL